MAPIEDCPAWLLRILRQYPLNPAEAFTSSSFDTFIPAELVIKARKERAEGESKQEMRKRGLPSPDEADVVALCFADPSGFHTIKISIAI
jgi:hypothetical protein